jgi:hypothetical protein
MPANRICGHGFAGAGGEFRYSRAQILVVVRAKGFKGREYWMGRSLIWAGILSAAALLALVTADVAGMSTVAGARADDTDQPRPPRRAKRRTQAQGYTLSPGASPAEIARYFQLYGGYIDPRINKQSPGGPFDSGFFFDSGIGRNGGDSPYLN